MDHVHAATTLADATAAFMPHGHCWLWTPGILWMTVLANATVALAYYSIPLVLLRLVRGRQDLPHPQVFVLFALFIVFCGTGHLVDIVTIWYPIYWFDAFWDLGTGLVSIATALVLWPLLPRLLAAPTLQQLAAAETVQRLEAQNQALEEAARRREEDHAALQAQVASMGRATAVLAEREARIAELRAEVARLRGEAP